MTIFSKDSKVATGPSFPFLEGKNGEYKMSYDAIEVSVKKDHAVLTFINNNVPIFAWTFDTDVFIMEGLKGTVDITLRDSGGYKQ